MSPANTRQASRGSNSSPLKSPKLRILGRLPQRPWVTVIEGVRFRWEDPPRGSLFLPFCLPVCLSLSLFLLCCFLLSLALSLSLYLFLSLSLSLFVSLILSLSLSLFVSLSPTHSQNAVTINATIISRRQSVCWQGASGDQMA